MRRLQNPALAGSVLLVLLSAYYAMGTYFGIKDEFTSADVRFIFPYAMLVVLIEAGVIFLCHRVLRTKQLTAGVTGAFIVLNAFSLQFVMSEAFISLGPAVTALLAAAGVSVGATAVLMASESRVASVAIPAFAALLAASPAAGRLLETPTGGPAGNAATRTASDNVRVVDFVEHPNVYFIGFESAQPQAVLSKYLKLDDAPLPAMLRERGYRTIPNLFSEDSATKGSLHRILDLDPAYSSDFKAFSGTMPAPLLQIFAANGYETNTLYANGYFGEQKGPYVDHYLFGAGYSVCSFMLPWEAKLAFLGACNLRSDWKPMTAGDYNRTEAPVDLLLDYLAEMQGRSRPQLLFAHISPPEHTPNDYAGSEAELASFRDYYREISVTAADNMRKVTDAIRTREAEAIIFVFGDHGIWLSRRTLAADDPSFTVQDRYAVLGGVQPADACADYLPRDGGPPSYYTLPMVALAIIRCLAGGAEPLVGPRALGIKIYSSPTQPPFEVSLEQYLYE